MLLNEVFSAVKKYCINTTHKGGDTLEEIMDELRLTTNPLEVYLQILKNMNLIDFSLGESNRFISLTELGTRVNEVPDSMPSIIL